MQAITLNKSRYYLYHDDNIFINQHCDLISVRNIRDKVTQSPKTGDYHLCWSNHRSNITLEYYRGKENQEDSLIVDNQVFYKIKSIPRENKTKLVHIFSDKCNCYAVTKIQLNFQRKNYKHPIVIDTQKIKAIFQDGVTYFDNDKSAYQSQLEDFHSNTKVGEQK